MAESEEALEGSSAGRPADHPGEGVLPGGESQVPFAPVSSWPESSPRHLPTSLTGGMWAGHPLVRRAALPVVVLLVGGLVALSYRSRAPEPGAEAGDELVAAPTTLPGGDDEEVDDDEAAGPDPGGVAPGRDDEGSERSSGPSGSPPTTEPSHQRASSTEPSTDPSSTDPSSTDPSSTDPSSTDPSSITGRSSTSRPTSSSTSASITVSTVRVTSTTQVATTARSTTSTTRATTTTAEPTTTTRPTTTTARRPSTTALGSNLIVNGGFELASLDNGYTITAYGPWSSSAGQVEIWRSGHSGVDSPAGSYHAELNVHDTTTYSQALATTRGATYQWSLSHRGRTDTDSMELLIDGQVVQRITSGTAWSSYSGTFVAASRSTTFALRSIDGGGAANLIDSVRVREVMR